MRIWCFDKRPRYHLRDIQRDSFHFLNYFMVKNEIVNYLSRKGYHKSGTCTAISYWPMKGFRAGMYLYVLLLCLAFWRCSILPETMRDIT